MKIDSININAKTNDYLNEVKRSEKKSLFRCSNEGKTEHMVEEKELREISRICNDQSISESVQIRRIIEVMQEDNAVFQMLTLYHQEKLMEVLLEFIRDNSEGRNLFNSLKERVKG